MSVHTPSTRILGTEGDLMRGQMLKALQSHVKASIELHKAINKIYLANPGGIGEHSDILEAVQTELDKMSVHSDRLE